MFFFSVALEEVEMEINFPVGIIFMGFIAISSTVYLFPKALRKCFATM